MIFTSLHIFLVDDMIFFPFRAYIFAQAPLGSMQPLQACPTYEFLVYRCFGARLHEREEVPWQGF